MRHQREVTEDGKVRHGIIFDDPIELVDMVHDGGTHGRFERYMGREQEIFGWKNRRGEDRDAFEWLGRTDLKSWDDFRQAISRVWEPGEKRVKLLLEMLSKHPFIPPRDLRRRAVWRDDNDGDFDLDRFTDGRPAWRGPMRRELIGRQFLTFVVDVSANCQTSAQSMYWRAAVAIACAQTLEEYGYGVEVLACANIVNTYHPPGRKLADCDEVDLQDAEDNWFNPLPRRGMPRRKIPLGIDQDVTAAVWVKRPDDAVDMGMLTAVCSPWFFRLGFFGLYGLVPGCVPHLNLGQCVAIEPDRLNDLTGVQQADRVILADVWTELRAAELMRATLRKYADPEWLADNPEPKPERKGSL